MFRSAEPYATRAQLTAPVICYQGAAVVDRETRAFLLHQPLDLDVAHEAIALLTAAGYPPNVYVDDELYVERHTEYSRRYADFQRLPVTEVGPLRTWLVRPPTKLVVVGDPTELPVVRAHLADALGSRVFLTRSLPHLLELGHPDVSKGTGLTFVAAQLGVDLDSVVAFGDGENDRELLATAGFGIAVENADHSLDDVADARCPGPEAEGVATVIEAALDFVA